MRRSTWLRVTCAALMVAVTTASHAQNLLLEDYRVPVSSATALRLSLEYDYARLGTQEIENRGNLFANYRYFYDSLPFAYSIDASLSADRSEQGRTFFGVNANERARAYVAGDLFVGAELRREYLSQNAETAKAEAVLGLGYGRFINATPLAKAVRMEDGLLELDQLYDDLPMETMIEWGQIIQRESEFRARYGETYRQEWFLEMERLIRDSGMMKQDELDAVALLRMDEALNRERIFDRFFGWEVSLGVGSDVFLHDDKDDGDRTRTLEAVFRLAKPFGWRTQWNETLTLSSPIGDDLGEVGSLVAVNELSYELSDRIDLLLTHRLTVERNRLPGGRFDTTVDHRFQGAFVFFIENSLTLNVNAIIDETRGTRQRAITTTFGYRLF